MRLVHTGDTWHTLVSLCPTSTSRLTMLLCSWEEDKDPATLSVESVHEHMGTHRLTALTPVSFQPQRHIPIILGRPFMVHLWSKKIVCFHSMCPAT